MAYRSTKEEIRHLIVQSIEYAQDLEREEQKRLFPDEEKIYRLSIIQRRLAMVLRLVPTSNNRF